MSVKEVARMWVLATALSRVSGLDARLAAFLIFLLAFFGYLFLESMAIRAAALSGTTISARGWASLSESSTSVLSEVNGVVTGVIEPSVVSLPTDLLLTLVFVLLTLRLVPEVSVLFPSVSVGTTSSATFGSRISSGLELLATTTLASMLTLIHFVTDT